MATPLVGLIMGSRSDWETMRHAAETLDELGVAFEQRVVSAHRTPDLLFEYASTAEERGLRVLIAGAGGAAHLPGMAASKTTLPVLGVPVESKALSGMDSLLSIVQMPAGVPVGTLAIGRAGAVNAALLAAAILAGSDAALGNRLRRFRAAQTDAVLDSPIQPREPEPVVSHHEPMTLVACIGGGQLGRMLGLAGLPLGLSFRFLDPSPDACARGVGELVVGEYGDPDALDRLADGAHVVTYEFENVPVESAERVGAVPGRAALEHGQDRLREKELFRSLGIATARFGTLEATGLPALVKSRRLGYDGKGQRRVDTPDPPREGEIAEELVPFDRELSIVGVRGRDGETRFWPVAENLHREGILRVTRAPAPDAAQREAESICATLMDALGYVGVLAVELSRWAAAYSRTSSRRACTTRGTGRSTAPRRASSRTTCARSSACRSGRRGPARNARWST